MTTRIYEQDAYCKCFDAVVTACEKTKQGYQIALDQTAFYPEGGGQPGDFGTLTLVKEIESGTASEDVSKQMIKVVDTHSKEGIIWHMTDQELPVGANVHGEIDWDHRFMLMQNHSGEHIFSGYAHALFGCSNVGFHMGSDFITIDFDVELSGEQIQLLEEKANAYIWSNRKVEIITVTSEEAENISYRSKKELTGDIRIVTFPEADICACCGTHVAMTGEIGLLKTFGFEKFRGGVRISLLCGKRAVDYLGLIYQQNKEAAAVLSVKYEQTGEATAKLNEKFLDTNYRMMGAENKLFAMIAKQHTGDGNLVLFEEDLDANGVRRLAVEVMETCGGYVAVFSGNEEDGYKYAIGGKDMDLRSIVKEMNSALNGRGGGKPFFAQGSVQAKRDVINAFFATRA